MNGAAGRVVRVLAAFAAGWVLGTVAQPAGAAVPDGPGWTQVGVYAGGDCGEATVVDVPSGVWQFDAGLGWQNVMQGPTQYFFVGPFGECDDSGWSCTCLPATLYARPLVPEGGDTPASAASGAAATERTTQGVLNATYALCVFMLVGLGVHGYAVGAKDA